MAPRSRGFGVKAAHLAHPGATGSIAATKWLVIVAPSHTKVLPMKKTWILPLLFALGLPALVQAQDTQPPPPNNVPEPGSAALALLALGAGLGLRARRRRGDGDADDKRD